MSTSKNEPRCTAAIVATVVAILAIGCQSRAIGTGDPAIDGTRSPGAPVGNGATSPPAGSGQPAPGGERRMGCDKMDVVFVVDNSRSMAEEQQNLAQSFPGFASALEAYVTPSGSPLDYRLAVTTTDTVNDRGAFRSTGAGCDAGPARPWLERGDVDLISAFGCRARAGTTGDSYERPLHALQLGLSDRIQDGTNVFQGQSFVRSEAVLAFVVITDEDEGGLENHALGTIPGYVSFLDRLKGSRGQWASALIAGLSACSSPQLGSAGEASRLKDFIGQAGGSGVAMSICSGDLASGLKLALDEFMQACDGW